MQDCFREHTEMYESELEDDDVEVEEELRAREAAKGPDGGSSDSKKFEKKSSEPLTPTTQEATESKSKPTEERHRDGQNSTMPKSTTHSGDEGGELVPRAAHDATSKK